MERLLLTRKPYHAGPRCVNGTPAPEEGVTKAAKCPP